MLIKYQRIDPSAPLGEEEKPVPPAVGDKVTLREQRFLVDSVDQRVEGEATVKVRAHFF